MWLRQYCSLLTVYFLGKPTLCYQKNHGSMKVVLCFFATIILANLLDFAVICFQHVIGVMITIVLFARSMLATCGRFCGLGSDVLMVVKISWQHSIHECRVVCMFFVLCACFAWVLDGNFQSVNVAYCACFLWF